MAEFSAFVRRHVALAFLITLGGALNVYGFLSDAYNLAHAGLPPAAWEAVGAAVFFVSIVILIYRVNSVREKTEKTETGVTMPLPLPENRNDEQEGRRVYEGAHERLMTFVVEHIFRTCGAREDVHACIIRALCPNGPLAALAILGAGQHPNISTFRIGMDGLSGLSNSPPDFISFDSMIESVADVERGYVSFLGEADRIAQSGYIDLKDFQSIANLWEAWRIDHNAMVRAFGVIKLDSKMGPLFRPARPSRWGQELPQYPTGVVPLRLLLRDTEGSKPP